MAFGQTPSQTVAMGMAELENCSTASSPLPQISASSPEHDIIHSMDGADPNNPVDSMAQNLPPPRKGKRKNHRGGRKKKRKGCKAGIDLVERAGLPSLEKCDENVEETEVALELERRAALAMTETFVAEGRRNADSTPAASRIDDGSSGVEEGASTKDGDDDLATDDLAAALSKSENEDITSGSIDTTISTTEDMVTRHEIGPVDTGAERYLDCATGEEETTKGKEAKNTTTIAEEETATASRQAPVFVEPSVEEAGAALVDSVDVEKDSVAVEVVIAVMEEDDAAIRAVEEATEQHTLIESEAVPLLMEVGDFDITAEQNITVIVGNDHQTSGDDGGKTLLAQEIVLAKVDDGLRQRACPAVRTGSCKPRRALIEELTHDKGAKGPYEVRPAPGKGLGMFATKRIPRGTRILAEEALMVVPEMSFSAVLPVFAALEPGKKAAFMELAGAEDEEEEANLAWCMAEADKDVDPSQRIALNYEDQAAVQMIFGANSFNVDAQTSAIFPIASRMNHSCIPNVYHTWNRNIDRLTVHALRDIALGEELLTTYIPAILTREQRNDDDHLGNYGFVCTCPACDSRSKFFKRSGFRRANVVAIEERLAPYFASGSLREAFARNAGPLSGVEEAFMCAQLRVNLLMEEGIVNMDLVKCIHEAGELALLLGDFEEAMKCATSAVRLTETCAGEDSPHMAVLQLQVLETERILRLCWSDGGQQGRKLWR